MANGHAKAVRLHREAHLARRLLANERAGYQRAVDAIDGTRALAQEQLIDTPYGVV